ncbi:hypothetical protein X798_04149 [Onchocerca flexuosa]|uniref:CCD97-like C-terminal domain-containing protein n=1 Tax=Onchocerca flexuosa TaxID=387005 RepID=A0A238BV07_9BILA|nr:hypothetical protein X798_04149 [Onchocerca flexuosa]
MGIAEKLTDLKITPSMDKMIDRIISHEDIFYRSEQRDTPDLTIQEKRELLENLYLENPHLFMRRYHKYLAVEDCGCFDQNEYEIQFYVKAIIERCKDRDTKKRKNVELRNQRYAELLRLKTETDYFSDKKMREREPLLFEKMIGRFLSEEEQIYLRPTIENESLSGVFMQFEDSQIVSNRRTAHLNEWNDFLKCDRNASKFGDLVQHARSRFCEEIESGSNDEMKSEDDCEEVINGDLKPTSSRDDIEFYDYSLIDNVMTREYERMYDRDLEDAYFEND